MERVQLHWQVVQWVMRALSTWFPFAFLRQPHSQASSLRDDKMVARQPRATCFLTDLQERRDALFLEGLSED